MLFKSLLFATLMAAIVLASGLERKGVSLRELSSADSLERVIEMKKMPASMQGSAHGDSRQGSAHGGDMRMGKSGRYHSMWPGDYPSSCVWYYIDDGDCDDINNVPECEFDGGDCCGPEVNTQYCEVCECLGCYEHWWVGDGICDDGNNKEWCDWDGGDCCLPIYFNDRCTECECLEPECSQPYWIGDGVCDDANNYYSCDWDGGDCCNGLRAGSDLWWCSDCRCKAANQRPWGYGPWASGWWM